MAEKYGTELTVSEQLCKPTEKMKFSTENGYSQLYTFREI